jgi:two-component system response regulator HydG
MNVELVVVNGSAAGARYPIDQDVVLIGRAPNSHIVLSEQEVGWRHCEIRRQGERFSLTDLRSTVGTYINGTRSAERWLEDRDQIGVGKTILMFRNGSAAEPSASPAPAEPAETRPILLAACSAVFLFRALAASMSGEPNFLLQSQILRLVGDLIPASGGVLLLGGSLAELQDALAAHPREEAVRFGSVLEPVCEEGAYTNEETLVIGVPLYLSGDLAGVLIMQLPPAERPRLATQLETLTAIASLAAIGFEANREVETLRAVKALLEAEIGQASGIVGRSPAIRRLLELIDRLAPRDTTVLITGESGTGKELIARALHDKSLRRERPFIAVNCAALSETLFESELFGHEKGAFTGAISLKRGRFELAEGGTIFLDEVGELAISLQAKLLRVLQQREFERVGGTHPHPLDIRIIAATNRDLADDVREGRFREDLYHRLNVVTLNSPPLRDHADDILLLANYFLERSAKRCKRQIVGISPEASELLVHYSWPGNVRELENAMERAVVLGVSDRVLPEDLPEGLLEAGTRDASARYHLSVGHAKREAILEAYAQGNWDYKQAARTLGLHPNYLLRLVRNLGLREELNRLQAGGAAR